MREVIRALPALRFIVPVRNPVDTALSTHSFYARHGTPEYLRAFAPERGYAHALRYVLATLKYCLDLQVDYPDRVHAVYQDELGEASMSALERFLGLPADAQWLADVSS